MLCVFLILWSTQALAILDFDMYAKRRIGTTSGGSPVYFEPLNGQYTSQVRRFRAGEESDFRRIIRDHESQRQRAFDEKVEEEKQDLETKKGNEKQLRKKYFETISFFHERLEFYMMLFGNAGFLPSLKRNLLHEFESRIASFETNDRNGQAIHSRLLTDLNTVNALLNEGELNDEQRLSVLGQLKDDFVKRNNKESCSELLGQSDLG